MQTQWHIKIDCDWQTITHEITPRVRVIVDLSHAIRTIAKDGQAIDTCQFGPDILRHYQWLLRIAEDAEQDNPYKTGCREYESNLFPNRTRHRKATLQQRKIALITWQAET